jgi:hypothetical protein
MFAVEELQIGSHDSNRTHRVSERLRLWELTVMTKRLLPSGHFSIWRHRRWRSVALL